MNQEVWMLDHRVVSAIITTRNRPEFLARAAASVEAQNYRPIELIIVDDGSNLPVTADLVGPLDGIRLKIVRNAKPKGVSAARNIGARAANGHFIAFLDDDDEWIPEKITKQVDCLLVSDGKLSGCGCHMNVLNSAGHLIDEPKRSLNRSKIIADLIASDKNIAPSTLLFDRHKFLEIGGYREDMSVAEDCEFLLRFLLKLDFAVLPDRLVNFTEHQGVRLTRNYHASYEGERDYLRFVLRNRDALGVGRKVLGYRHAKLGHQAMLARKWLIGIKYYFIALTYDPISYRALGGASIAILGPPIYHRLMSLHMERIR